MLVVDREQKINLVNLTGNESLGYDEFELIGQNMFDVLVSPEDKEKGKEIFTKIISGSEETSSSVEIKMLKKNGDQMIVNWSFSPMYDSEENIEALICSGKDITELRIKDELLLSLKEIKETFSDMLHHDLLGSASNIQEYAKLLLELETKPQNEAYIQKIVQNISNMIETLENASTYLERQLGE
jgi:PAS domain S-box-containing protein